MNVRRHALALSSSATLVALLVFGLALLQQLNAPSNAVETLRRIDMNAALPPPPPPPQTQRRESAQETLDLDLGSSQASTLNLPPARVEQTLTVDDLDAPIPEMQVPTFDVDLNASIREFGLAQLDGRPRLLTDLSILFPESLRRRGISSVKIEAQVVIDQSGSVTLRRLINNPHDELEPQIRAVMRRARFTPPEKDGQRVRAAFVWPLVLQSQ
ncbi:MAG: energy transducer TonB [Pseudomonadota bacterium]